MGNVCLAEERGGRGVGNDLRSCRCWSPHRWQESGRVASVNPFQTENASRQLRGPFRTVRSRRRIGSRSQRSYISERRTRLQTDSSTALGLSWPPT
jgi:hypothetical protein